MKITDKRCITLTLTRLEVKEILLKALCEMHPGYQPGEADHRNCVDLSDLPPEIEVVLSPKPSMPAGDIEVITPDGQSKRMPLL